MKILSYRKIKNNIYEINLDNGENFSLYDEVILKENLLIKKNIDQAYLNQLIKQNEFYELYNKVLKFLKSKMRCAKEIYRKFEDEYSAEDIGKVLEKLYKEHYLNDNDYIKAYINDAIMFKKVGPAKIKKELMLLGFEEEQIEEVLNNIDNSFWNDKIKHYVDKAIKSNKKLSAYALKQKILTDLITKGFAKENINNYLDTIRIGSNKDIYNREYQKLYQKLAKKYKAERLDYEVKIRLKAKGFDNYLD